MTYQTASQYTHLLFGLLINHHPFLHYTGYNELNQRHELVAVFDHPTEHDIDRVSRLALRTSQAEFANSDSFSNEYIGVILAKDWGDEVEDCATTAGNVFLVRIGNEVKP